MNALHYKRTNKSEHTLAGCAAAKGVGGPGPGASWVGLDKVKRTHIKMHFPVPLQDWKEQYIHENYSLALEGEGLVEQVSPAQDL